MGVACPPDTQSYPAASASAMFNFLKTAGVALLVVASSALAADVRILTLRDLAVTESSCVEGVGRKTGREQSRFRQDDAPTDCFLGHWPN